MDTRHGVIDEDHLRCITRGSPRADRTQCLLASGAAFTVTIDTGARLALNPVAIAERLRGLGDGFCRVRGAFDGLAAKTHFRRNPAKRAPGKRTARSIVAEQHMYAWRPGGTLDQNVFLYPNRIFRLRGFLSKCHCCANQKQNSCRYREVPVSSSSFSFPDRVIQRQAARPLVQRAILPSPILHSLTNRTARALPSSPNKTSAWTGSRARSMFMGSPKTCSAERGSFTRTNWRCSDGNWWSGSHEGKKFRFNPVIGSTLCFAQAAFAPPGRPRRILHSRFRHWRRDFRRASLSRARRFPNRLRGGLWRLFQRNSPLGRGEGREALGVGCVRPRTHPVSSRCHPSQGGDFLRAAAAFPLHLSRVSVCARTERHPLLVPD